MLPATHKHQSCGDYQPGGSTAERCSCCLGDGIDDGLYSICYSVSILCYIMHISYSYYDNLQIYKNCREKLRMNNEEIAQQHEILSVSVGPVLFFLFKAQRTSLLKKSLNVITTDTEDFQDHDKALWRSLCFLWWYFETYDLQLKDFETAFPQRTAECGKAVRK